MDAQSSVLKVVVIVLAVISVLTLVGALGVLVLHPRMMSGMVSCQTTMWLVRQTVTPDGSLT